MGTNNHVEPKRRKKKGRPSLLDLQKRSLRLQHQQEQKKNPNPNPNPNPYLRFPASSYSSPGRRATRRNLSPDPGADANAAPDDDEDDDDSTGRRKEKKLRFVLRIPAHGANSASDSDGAAAGARKRKIDALVADRDELERRNSASKATDPSQDSGPTTPLPDKKLLVFILDRLQKKDSYGVFSEPVDPNELPDYHDIIEHPMDFGTIRKKLSSGAYANLEQFEKDVFLISSNAMRYNARDTIYYRQARSIQELATKNFENLRQESDDNEPEPKPVRRGRPPSKKTVKQSVGRPPSDRVGSDFSPGATLASAGDNGHFSNLANDLSRRGSAVDKPRIADLPGGAYHLRNADTHSWISGHRTERNEDFSGSGMKNVSTKYGKKLSAIDENRRNTYKQPQLSTSVYEPAVLTALDGERKQLVPVGLHMEHAYARSLARFAANLGPIGWEIAAKQIQRALPRGMRFGPGWVGESEVPHQSRPLLSTSLLSAFQPKITSPTMTVSTAEPSNNLTAEGSQVITSVPLPALTCAVPSRPTNSTDRSEPAAVVNYGSLGNSGGVIQPKTLHQNAAIQPNVNGFNTSLVFNLPSHAGKVLRPSRPPGSSCPTEVMNTYAGAFGAVSRSNNSHINQAPLNQSNADKMVVRNPSSSSNSGSHFLGSGHSSQGPWRGLSNAKPGSVSPDLNVGFQSTGSPVPGVLVDSQHPDLALQL
ncbi:bromodomain-containing protein DDB_G0270170-like [Phoenix dactylifera]|uniref:Bromodomain-containing protein DDB_G0270170-like n=1 Tax=Phoenix dactylifera TaxID=42345 RepID=A0A8B7CFM4_PHODC|nr:bromodomain-containing protein DDB_G0270170-like [Phoenix dactylifera]